MSAPRLGCPRPSRESSRHEWCISHGETQMRWLNNIASRAAFGFAVVWGLTAVAVVGSVVLARDASDVLEGTLIGYADDLMHASQAQFAAERMVAVGRGYLLTREPELLARAKEAE